jgi:glycosyltransferase involved in cell wall biosynthesis
VGAGPKAVVLTGYAVNPVLVRGGAQRVATELCDRLVELGWKVDVIECVAWCQSIDPGYTLAAGMAGHTAIVRGWRDAAAPTVLSGEDLHMLLAEVGLVLVMDRAVGRLDTPAHKVLLLSNLTYDNERRAALHGDHEAVWVPSPHLAQQLEAVAGDGPNAVHVVPPALAQQPCDAVAHAPLDTLGEQLMANQVPRQRSLLFPHRADPGKGLIFALTVLRLLLAEDRWTLVAIEPGADEDADVKAVIDNARRFAANLGIMDWVVWVPWLPQSEVSCLYKLGGVTLMPSTLDEGFGLVAVESLAQGVPVVALPSGNLRRLAACFSSLHLAEGVTAVARTVAGVAGSAVPAAEREAVRRSYSVDAQRDAVVSALRAVGIAV